MQKLIEHKRVPFTPEQMYTLIASVEHYSEFLPFCSASQLLQRDDQTQVAELTVSKGPLRQQFTTRNRLSPFDRLGIELVRGPFKTMTGEWRFDVAPGGCDVTLKLEFEFTSRLLQMTAGPVFKEVNRAMVDAFVKRARHLYA